MKFLKNFAFAVIALSILNLVAQESVLSEAELNTTFCAIADALTTKKHIAPKVLTAKQKQWAINFFTDLNELTKTTASQLITMGNACKTKEQRDAMNETLEKALEDALLTLPSNTQPDMKSIRAMEQNIDLKNPSWNKIKNYLCHCAYLDDAQAIMQLKLASAPAQKLQAQFSELCEAIALPFVVFNDWYFFNGWEDAFTKSAQVFAEINPLCTQVLTLVK